MNNDQNLVQEVKNCEVESTETTNLEEVQSPVQKSPSITMKDCQALIKQLKEMLNYQESIWKQVQSEFEVDTNQMKLIIDYNDTNAVVPENVKIDDPNTYPEDFDFLNGIDNISDEKLNEIFGDDSKIFGVDHTQTVDRVKWAAQTFYNYVRSLFDFNNISKEYSNLIEDQERISIETMKVNIEKENDLEKKALMQKQLDEHFYFKQLMFLKDPVDDRTAGHIISTFGDGRKTQYIIDRTRNALTKISVSEKFILEIAQFEKLYLDEKYHQQSNLLLMYFMNLIVFNDMDAKNNAAKRKVLSMVVNIDKYIRKGLSEEDSAIILQNILALEDQFLGKILSPAKL